MSTDMTDEPEIPQETETIRQVPDDARFEVKWRKKNESSAPSQPTESNEQAPVADDVDDLRRQLEEERQRVKDLQDRWHRSAADLANLRKRTEQERGEVEKFASLLLVQELLPVLDNFGRALATIPGNLAMLTWIQGVMLVERHLSSILDRQGLQPIEAEGQPFDPHYHEAVAEREVSDVAPGTIVQEYQKGYTMHGRVIRPSLVEVSRAPVQQAEPAAAQQSETVSAQQSEAAREQQPEPTPVHQSDTAPAASPESTSSTQAEEIAREAESENTGP